MSAPTSEERATPPKLHPAIRNPQSAIGPPHSAIEARGLRKTFGKTVAVAGLDLCVAEGEIFGLVGPDGAGKTTTFRLLLGLLIPDTGEARIGGCDVHRRPQEARALVGYVAQNFTLYGDLSIEENMRFVAQVRNLERGAYRERAEELLALTALAPFTRRLGRDLSGGMKRKLALVCALLHRPRVVILDEPTTGVDPVSRREFWRMLYALPSEGVTLLVSTPYMDEAERCHRLGFMAGGRLLALDTPAGLLRRMPDGLVEIRTERRMEARKLLTERPEVRRIETLGGLLRVAFDPHAPGLENGCAFGAWLEERGLAVAECRGVAPTLSDVFGALSEASGGPE
jgi:ABC-2 type transport system ATP-binding protein